MALLNLVKRIQGFKNRVPPSLYCLLRDCNVRPCIETHPVARHIIDILNSSDSDSVSASNIPVVWYQSYYVPTLDLSSPATPKITIASSPSYEIAESLLVITRPLDP